MLKSNKNNCFIFIERVCKNMNTKVHYFALLTIQMMFSNHITSSTLNLIIFVWNCQRRCLMWQRFWSNISSYYFQNDVNQNGNSLGIGNNGLSSMMLSLNNHQTNGTTPIVLKDRLLTDSVVFSEDFPSINGSNHTLTATSNNSSNHR